MKKHVSAIIGLGAGCIGALTTLTLVQPALTPSVRPAPTPVQFTHAPRTLAPSSALSSPSFSDAAERSVDAVVHVKTVQRSQSAPLPWFEMFGYGQPERISQGSGSGVIINSEGHIVTNNHVIDGADEIVVSLNNNRTYTAEVVGTDPSTDLAVLKIDAPVSLPHISFGSSQDVRVGEWVLAVGNPFDLTSTVTAGIVSAKSRDINILRGDPRTMEYPIESFIQTDAAVNPGNSGGALVNTSGELIGINTAIASRTGSYSGYSFAIPSAIVEKVVNDLRTFGEVRRAYLGIQIEPVDERLAAQLQLTEVAGCAIVGIVPHSGAFESELREGDVVLAIDGTSITDFPELQECVAKYHPGDIVNVAFSRDGTQRETQVQLKNKEGSTEIANNGARSAHQTWIDGADAALSPVPTEVAQSLGLEGGVQVTALSPGGFSQSGIRKGFIITKINGESIQDAEHIEDFFTSGEGGLLIEGVYPNGQRAYYGMAASL